jgi:hypothetical protein
MPYNLLIFPLCGGYFILLNFVYFKYRYQRLSSQRILFNSIIAGVFLLFFTFILRAFIAFIFPEAIDFIYEGFFQNFPISHINYLWTSVASFTIAICLTFFANSIVILFFGYQKPIGYAVRKYGDEVEKLFRTSAKTGELMQITLKNNKVYIGFTDIIPVPKETNYLKITPVLSGYRESESKILRLTTDYFDILDIYMSDHPKFNIYDIDISIKQDEILTAGIYDQNVFNLFRGETTIDAKSSV